MSATNLQHTSAAERLSSANMSAPFAAYQGWQQDLRSVLDENKRLREALEKISDVRDDGSWFPRYTLTRDGCYLAASAALAKEDV